MHLTPFRPSKPQKPPHYSGKVGGCPTSPLRYGFIRQRDPQIEGLVFDRIKHFDFAYRQGAFGGNLESDVAGVDLGRCEEFEEMGGDDFLVGPKMVGGSIFP